MLRVEKLLLPALGLVALAFVYPAAELLGRSFTEPPGGFSHYQDVFGSSSLMTIVGRSALTAALVMAVSLLLGFPVAWLAANSSPRVAKLILGVVAASLFVSVIVRGYSWLAILDRNGVLNTVLGAIGLESMQRTLVHNRAGVVIGMSQYGIPFMILPLYDVMSRFDNRLLAASANLGARQWTTFWRVYVPLILPGIGAGCTIVFIATLGYYVLPSILGGPGDVMIGELIADKIQTTGDWGQGTALASVLLAVALLFFVAFYRFSLRGREGSS
ncbi:ABC transporter permease [Conexibacter arvalis]|nr:ABC transporter permease [Conexibacter arvalis]